jgi:hypothetical protein
LVGGGAIVGAGLLSMLIGPSRLSVDTSKDAFLRRAGLHQMLEKTYRDRFREKAHLYAPITLLALAYPGYTRLSGFARRFLLAWGIISLAAVPVGFVTGLFPPERVLTFGFVFPILAPVFFGGVVAVSSVATLASARVTTAADFPPYDSLYHTYPEMVAEIQATRDAHPDIVALSSIGKSYQGRDLPFRQPTQGSLIRSMVGVRPQRPCHRIAPH